MKSALSPQLLALTGILFWEQGVSSTNCKLFYSIYIPLKLIHKLVFKIYRQFDENNPSVKFTIGHWIQPNQNFTINYSISGDDKERDKYSISLTLLSFLCPLRTNLHDNNTILPHITIHSVRTSRNLVIIHYY